MTPQPAQDKPAGKVKLTKAQLKVLRRVAQRGETLAYASGDGRSCGRAWFLRDIRVRVASSTLWSLISERLIAADRPTKKTPWYATYYSITAFGRRALKESSK